MLDVQVATELKEAFARDLENCHELDLETWRRRPARKRLLDRLAYLLHDQL